MAMRWNDCLGYICQLCRWCFSTKQISEVEKECVVCGMSDTHLVQLQSYLFAGAVYCSLVLLSADAFSSYDYFCRTIILFLVYLFIYALNIQESAVCLNSSDIISGSSRLLEEYDLKRHTVPFIYYIITRNNKSPSCFESKYWMSLWIHHTHKWVFICYMYVCILQYVYLSWWLKNMGFSLWFNKYGVCLWRFLKYILLN